MVKTIRDRKIFHFQEFLEELPFLNNLHTIDKLAERVHALLEGIFIKDLERDKIAIYVYNPGMRKYCLRSIDEAHLPASIYPAAIEREPHACTFIELTEKQDAWREFFTAGFSHIFFCKASRKFSVPCNALIIIASENYRGTEADVYIELMTILSGVIAISVENILFYKEALSYKKFAALGKIVAKIAHEINNPLCGIMNYANVLRKNMDTAADMENKRYSDIIVKETNRCKAIVEEILKLSRDKKCAKKKMNLNVCIQEALDILKVRIDGKNIDIQTQYADECRFIVSDKNLLAQVFTNIIANAAEAVAGQGGAIHIHTEYAEPYAVITITDNGCGIPAEGRQHIFEPFYSTKDSGLGLGLSVVFNIIKRLEGTIEVAGNPGGGTVFTISLPRGNTAAVTAG